MTGLMIERSNPGRSGSALMPPRQAYMDRASVILLQAEPLPIEAAQQDTPVGGAQADRGESAGLGHGPLGVAGDGAPVLLRPIPFRLLEVAALAKRGQRILG